MLKTEERKAKSVEPRATTRMNECESVSKRDRALVRAAAAVAIIAALINSNNNSIKTRRTLVAE